MDVIDGATPTLADSRDVRDRFVPFVRIVPCDRIVPTLPKEVLTISATKTSPSRRQHMLPDPMFP